MYVLRMVSTDTDRNIVVNRWLSNLLRHDEYEYQ